MKKKIMTFKKENLQIFTYILKKNDISVILSDLLSKEDILN